MAFQAQNSPQITPCLVPTDHAFSPQDVPVDRIHRKPKTSHTPMFSKASSSTSFRRHRKPRFLAFCFRGARGVMQVCGPQVVSRVSVSRSAAGPVSACRTGGRDPVAGLRRWPGSAGLPVCRDPVSSRPVTRIRQTGDGDTCGGWTNPAVSATGWLRLGYLLVSHVGAYD